MYEMLYSFASKKNPLGDESLVSDEEIAEAKEYITNNMTEIFDKKTAYLRLSHLLLDNCFHELFLKDRLVLEIPTELLADPVTREAHRVADQVAPEAAAGGPCNTAAVHETETSRIYDSAVRLPV